MNKWYLIVLFSFSVQLKAESYYDYVNQQLADAEAYLMVNPAHTLTILDAMGPVSQPAEQALRWHILLMRAAVPTAQFERMLTSLDAIFTYQNDPAFVQYLTSINSAAAIWLRRNDYLHDARLSLQCAEKYTTSTAQKLTLLNSMGLLNRQLDDYALAKQQFHRALRLATETQNTRVMAMAQNNLGLLALEQGELDLAVQHLRAALNHYQAISLRAGQISAGLNLLLAFMLQNDLQNVQRVYSPTVSLTEAFPNEAKQALLLWLQAGLKQRQGQAISANDKQALQRAYHQLDDIKTQALLYQHLVPLLQIDVKAPQPTVRQGFDRSWFSAIRHCQWPLPKADPDLAN